MTFSVYRTTPRALISTHPDVAEAHAAMARAGAGHHMTRSDGVVLGVRVDADVLDLWPWPCAKWCVPEAFRAEKGEVAA